VKTMAEIVAAYPGAPLALFGRYGIGSRDKFGFRPEQTLREVLARHLIFDEGPVLAYLAEADAEERAVLVDTLDGAVVDVRGPDEFALYRLPESRLLDAEVAAEVMADLDRSWTFVCREGPMAAAAARHFRGKGHRGVRALRGGLEGWAVAHPEFPSYRGRLRLLPGGHALRWKLARPLCQGLARVVGNAAWALEPSVVRLRSGFTPQLETTLPADAAEAGSQRLELSSVRALVWGDVITVVRPGTRDWQAVAPSLLAWAAGLPDLAGGALPADLRSRVEGALARDVAPRLVEHKGTVELARLEELVAYVRLGGGCQGCSSAGVTLSEEVAAAVFTAAPEILEVRDATDHAAGAAPHH